MGRIIRLLQLVILLTGCSVVPHERNQSASVRSAGEISSSHDLTIEKAIALDPPELVTWSPIPNTVESNSIPVAPAYHATVKVTSNSQQSAADKGASEGRVSFSIPLGAKLALLAVGLVMFLGAILLAWRYAKTTAFGQAIALADETFANRIRAIRLRASNEPPEERAKSHLEIADLEAERGRLKRK